MQWIKGTPKGINTERTSKALNTNGTHKPMINDGTLKAINKGNTKGNELMRGEGASGNILLVTCNIAFYSMLN